MLKKMEHFEPQIMIKVLYEEIKFLFFFPFNIEFWHPACHWPKPSASITNLRAKNRAWIQILSEDVEEYCVFSLFKFAIGLKKILQLKQKNVFVCYQKKA